LNLIHQRGNLHHHGADDLDLPPLVAVVAHRLNPLDGQGLQIMDPIYMEAKMKGEEEKETDRRRKEPCNGSVHGNPDQFPT
jgi:hypothetical protein